MFRGRGAISTIVLIVLAGSSIGYTQRTDPSPPQPPMSRARYEQMWKELLNWDRWGKDDQLGALNLITPAKRQQALALAKGGTHMSLGHDVLTPPFQLKVFIVPDNSAPMPRISDRIEIDFHGGSYTHLDALCHIAYNHRLFNGYILKDTVNATDGCAKNSVMTMKDGIVTRAVLVDIPRLRGVRYLEAGTRVTRAEVEAWERRANVHIGPGDAVLLRTGRWARPPEEPGTPRASGAGWDVWGVPLFKERDISVLGSDNAQEVANNIEPPADRLSVTAIHKAVGNAMGVAIVDNLDLEQAAETAARLNRWEFMLVISPLRVPHGTGSPVNPIGFF
jgi:kynurenine formamidase